MKTLGLIMTLTLLAACGRGDGQEGGNASQLHYITFGPGVSGLVAKVKKSKMRVCLSGVSEAETQAWADKIQSTILKWVKPLRPLTSDQLFQTVEVTPGRQGGCDTEVIVAPNTHSNTSIGSYPIVRMGDRGYFASYNVLLHEMGHAFALSDTYQNGQSGNCQAGQPQAVMCNTSFDDLRSDDVAGLTAVFKRSFPSDRPPAVVNPEPPVVQPEPPVVQPETTLPGVKLYAALGKDSGPDKYRVHFSVTGARAQDGTVAYCLDTATACKLAGARWVDLPSTGSRGDTPLYAMDRDLQLAESVAVTVRFKTAAGSAATSLAFRKGG